MGLTIAQLSERLRCAECGGPLLSVKPWRQADVLGKPQGRGGQAMAGAFKKMENALGEFSNKVDRCRDEDNSNMTDVKDAYSGMTAFASVICAMRVILAPPKTQP